jgi:F-type H+-transporting ATPase subunit b
MAGEVNVLAPHWREVATHAVAFTAAVLVLRRYAWKPILNLLDERRERIANEFGTIDREKSANVKLKVEYEAQLKTIDAQARAKIQEAVGEGRKVAGEIHEHAREEAHELMARAREEIDIEKDKAEVALKEDMVAMAMAAAEKVIRMKLDETVHRKLVSEAIDELTKMKTAWRAP